MNQPDFPTIGLGGTFDHFHLGHQQFLSFAATLADQVLIGVTVPELTTTKPGADLIETYDTRVAAVAHFCQQQGINYQIVPLTDTYGPTLAEDCVQALCATLETQAGVAAINEQRTKLGLATLPIFVCPLVPDDSGQEIHSVRIRAGHISRQGRVYAQLFTQDLVLTPEQRQYFSQPQGPVVFPNPNFTPSPLPTSSRRSVVGDTSLETFITHHWPYDVGVFDQKRQRQSVISDIIDGINPDTRTINPPGIISVQLIESLRTCLADKSRHVAVIGEEDLATVALALLLPLQSEIYYGQPNQGIVKLIVTEEMKERIYSKLATRI